MARIPSAPRNLRKATAHRESLPARPYHRIGDVARWLGVKPQTVREWCVWFDIQTVRSSAEKQGQRVFSRKQALLLGVIRELLYVELYTVAGAKRQLRLAAERERQQAQKEGAA